MRADGTPHVVPVGFSWDNDSGVARVITSGGSHKARNAELDGRVALCQVDGRRWLSLEGTACLVRDVAAVRDAEQRYERRYRTPRPNPARVVIEIKVNRLLGWLPRGDAL